MSEFLWVPRSLLEALLDEDACRFDEEGTCKEHGEDCAQQRLKELLVRGR